MPPVTDTTSIKNDTMKRKDRQWTTFGLRGPLLMLLLAAFLVPPLLRVLQWVNYGRPIQPVNTDRCTTISHPLARGCEDVVVDQVANLAYLPCGDAATRRTWWPPIQARNANIPGTIRNPVMLYDFETGKLEEVPVRGLDGDLVLHGGGLWRPSDPAQPTVLMLVNHRREGGSVIEIFEHVRTAGGVGELHHVETVHDPLIWSPNTVMPVSARSFYASNDVYFSSGLMRTLETLFELPLGNVVYRDSEQGTVRVVANHIAYANGVTTHPSDALLLVASASRSLVHVYERQSNGDLDYRGDVQMPLNADNLHADPSTGDIYVGGTMAPLAFFNSYTDPSVQVASQAARIKNLRVSEKGVSAEVETLVVYADGPGSTVTTASPHAARNTMLLSGVFTEEVLVCRIE